MSTGETDRIRPEHTTSGPITTVRIVITLKPGVLDAPGQAVQQGLQAMGFAQVAQVRVGRYVELIVAEGTTDAEIHQMCDRFLANPLIEAWRIDTDQTRNQASGPVGRDPVRPSI